MTAPWTASDSTAKIIPAFVAALQTVEDVKKNRKVDAGQMRYTYADLVAVLEATKTVLATNGLAVTQSASDQGVQTVLLHQSGEWLAFPPLTIGAAQNTPQARGSAISYARRYSMLAVLGIATEDDDGKAASTAPKQPRAPKMTDNDRIRPRDTTDPEETRTNPGTPASSKQIQVVQIRMGELGIKTRDDKIATCCALIGRTITSSKQMTVAEASKVIDGLDKLDAGLIELVANDDGSYTVKEVA